MKTTLEILYFMFIFIFILQVHQSSRHRLTQHQAKLSSKTQPNPHSTLVTRTPTLPQQPLQEPHIFTHPQAHPNIICPIPYMPVNLQGLCPQEQ